MQGNYLETEKISKLLFKFSLPCILSLLISSLYNIVDQIFIGQSELGNNGIAATGVVFLAFIIAQGVAWCIGDGCAAYLSICQGRKDTEQIHKGIGTSLLLTLIISIVLTVIFLVFKHPLLMIFGCPNESYDLASRYFNYVVAFFPIFILMNMMCSIIRADGSPNYAMKAMILGAVINIILDPIFIFSLNMGIDGAAIATVIGQIATFILCFIYMFKTKTFTLKKDSFNFHIKEFLKIFILGISTFITQISIAVVSIVCNVMLKKYGLMSNYGDVIPITAITIETKIYTVVINLVVGVILGSQPIFGYNYGAKRFDRVKEAYLKVLMITLIIGIVSTIIFQFFPDLLIRMFSNDTNPLFYDYTEKMFRIFLMFIIMTLLVKMSSIFFQAVGKTIFAMISSLIRDLVFFVPLVILMPYFIEKANPGTGVEAILYAAPIADALTIVILVFLTISFFKTMNKIESA